MPSERITTNELLMLTEHRQQLRELKLKVLGSLMEMQEFVADNNCFSEEEYLATCQTAAQIIWKLNIKGRQ